MKEELFGALDQSQQERAKAMFLNARINDGYWYLIASDGIVLSRNRKKGGRSVKPHRSGGGHCV